MHAIMLQKKKELTFTLFSHHLDYELSLKKQAANNAQFIPHHNSCW